jgi:hypothetical protein
MRHTAWSKATSDQHRPAIGSSSRVSLLTFKGSLGVSSGRCLAHAVPTRPSARASPPSWHALSGQTCLSLRGSHVGNSRGVRESLKPHWYWWTVAGKVVDVLEGEVGPWYRASETTKRFLTDCWLLKDSEGVVVARIVDIKPPNSPRGPLRCCQRISNTEAALKYQILITITPVTMKLSLAVFVSALALATAAPVEEDASGLEARSYACNVPNDLCPTYCAAGSSINCSGSYVCVLKPSMTTKMMFSSFSSLL